MHHHTAQETKTKVGDTSSEREIKGKSVGADVPLQVNEERFNKIRNLYGNGVRNGRDGLNN